MRVLIVEDEKYLAESIRIGLKREAIAADVVHDGDTALEYLAVHDYDTVILDREIPGMHGDDVWRIVNERYPRRRVMMLSVARQLADKVAAFELGVDDYLAKPFEFPELVARLRALSRRDGAPRPAIFDYQGVQLDPHKREVFRDGRQVQLSRKEFAVLELLMEARGGVVTCETLLEKAWDENTDPFTNVVRVTVSTLRKRLGEPWPIRTVAGVGYRMI